MLCSRTTGHLFFYFFLERERRALVIHFPPFSHRITSQNFTLPLTPLHLFPLQMGHLDETGEAISSEKDTLMNETRPCAHPSTNHHVWSLAAQFSSSLYRTYLGEPESLDAVCVVRVTRGDPAGEQACNIEIVVFCFGGRHVEEVERLQTIDETSFLQHEVSFGTLQQSVWGMF